MKPTRTWILIANGNGAGIAEHTGPGSGLTMLDLEWSAEPAAEFSDRPGRSFKRMGPLRHSFEPHGGGNDPHETFARALASELSALQDADRFDRLIVCAPPALLGTLRKQLPDRLREAVAAEIAKDLTSVPAASLASHFSDVLAV